MTRERRDKDCDRLLADIAAGRHVVVLSGPPGAGKSWLARSAADVLAAQGAVIGAGKYADAEGQSAYGPIVSALSVAVAATLEREYDPQRALASLTDALGVHLEVLLALGLRVPGIDRPSMLQALADHRQWAGRIGAAVLALLGWLDLFGARPALLIDDWDRAPPAAMRLLGLAAATASRHPPTLLLTGRSRGPADLFPDDRVAHHRLGERDDDAVREMLAEALGDVTAAEAVLGRLAGDIPRLPFDIQQLAIAVRDANWLVPRGEAGWTVDPAQRGPLVYRPAERIATLSPQARRLTHAVALVGDGTAVSLLKSATAGDDTDASIAELQRAGIVACDGKAIAFRHDRLREAARADGDSSALAAEMAERLCDAGTTGTVALALRLTGGLDTAAPERWRRQFVDGATAARGNGDAVAAARFAEAALALSGRTPATDREEGRAILREALLAAAGRDDPETRVRAAALVATASTAAEQFADRELAITALRFAGDAEGAWRMLCDGLALVGIRLPARARLRHLVPALLAWRVQQGRRRWRGRLDRALAESFTGMANAAATTAYHRDPALTALIGFRSSVLVGRDARSACYWRGVDAFLFGVAGQPARAAIAGAEALRLLPQQPRQRAQSLYQAVFFGLLWTMPVAASRAHFREVVQLALAEGDPTMAAYGLRADVVAGWRSGADLTALLDQARTALRSLVALGEQSFVDEMTSLVAMLEGLTGARGWRADLWRTDLPARNHVIDLELSNLAGDWRGTLRLAEGLAPLARDYALQHESVLLRFHRMLARLRCNLRVSRADLRRLARAARLNPADHRAKLLLIDAERLRVRGRPCEHAYAAAVAAAEAADSRLVAGLASQCAADAMRERGDAEQAAHYARRAETIWRDWGVHPQARTASAAAIAEFAARADAAERADRAKTRLLAHVGHELRTPLQALQAQLDLAVADGRPLDPGAVRDVLASLDTVVEDLDLIGQQEGRSDRAEDAVDLPALIRSEMALWPGLAPENLTVAGDISQLALPASRLRQVVRNLLSNAVKYGGGTPIALTLSPMIADPPAIGLSVTDRGPGLPPDMLDRIFAPFERGAHQGDGRGAGLGLALSRRIAERLGGSLRAENVSGGGARFILALPARTAAEGAPIPPPDLATPSERSVKLDILLVEDTALIRQAIGALLSRAGHRVHAASDGTSAIAMLGRRTFDAAVLDIGLPDISGLVVLEAIRRDLGGLPVVLLTAAIDPAVTKVCSRDVATRALRKPVTAQTLIATLGDLCRAALPSPAGAPPEYARLKRAARREVRARGLRLARSVGVDDAAAHQLAGLAAQFGWDDVARAADALDASAAAAARLRAAVTAME